MRRVLVSMAALTTAGLAWAQEVPAMKMTTEIPEGVTTPDNIQTRVGELNFFDGVPDVESAQSRAENRVDQCSPSPMLP